MCTILYTCKIKKLKTILFNKKHSSVLVYIYWPYICSSKGQYWPHQNFKILFIFTYYLHITLKFTDHFLHLNPHRFLIPSIQANKSSNQCLVKNSHLWLHILFKSSDLMITQINLISRTGFELKILIYSKLETIPLMIRALK